MSNETIRIQDLPSMPRAAIDFIEKRLSNTACFLEYGAGGSTVLAARVGVPVIYSVESDRGYVEAVRQKVARTGAVSVLHSHYVDIGPTKRFGHPIDDSARARWDRYSASIWDVLERDGAKPDTILVDGRFRVACSLLSLLRMPEHAVMMLDDYVGREETYGIVADLVEIDQLIDRVAVFRKPPADRFDAIRANYHKYVRHSA